MLVNSNQLQNEFDSQANNHELKSFDSQLIWNGALLQQFVAHSLQ